MSRFTGLCWVCVHGATTFWPITLVSSLVGIVSQTNLGGRWCYKRFGTASGTSNQTTAYFRRPNHWHDAFLLWPTGMKESHTVGCHLWYKAGSRWFRFWDQTTLQFQGAPVSESTVFLHVPFPGFEQLSVFTSTYIYIYTHPFWKNTRIYIYTYICVFHKEMIYLYNRINNMNMYLSIYLSIYLSLNTHTYIIDIWYLFKYLS